jgi:hypothetical protein
MRPTLLLALLLTASLLPACGGKVFFGEADADGGGGSGGTSVTSTTDATTTDATTTNATTTTDQSAVSTSSVGGAPPSDCKGACDALYSCGLQDGLCPGFDGSPGQQEGFVQGCVQTCEEQPALINLVDPGNCDQTITTVKAVSVDFADFCDGAPFG